MTIKGNQEPVTLAAEKIAANLLGWYDVHRRDLPWRAKPQGIADPYHVWLSEIMLQQTTVATVKGYFEKFLTRWPTLQDMAAARQEDILEAWAGLGYYARARNLHKCAQILVAEHSGVFPETAAALKKLPGIGEYTSAAIASIAFGQSVAVVDSNVERIVTRLFQIATQLPKAKKAITLKTAQITPESRAGDFAQAMMDLGSSLCSPKAPDCSRCPLGTACQAFAAGDMEQYPVKPVKKPKPTRRAIAFALLYNDQLYLQRRADSGLLGGMLGLPHTPWIELDDFPTTCDSLPHAPTTADWQPVPGIATHTFTHFHLQSAMMKAEIQQKPNMPDGEWIRLADVEKAGLPTVFKKITKLIREIS